MRWGVRDVFSFFSCRYENALYYLFNGPVQLLHKPSLSYIVFPLYYSYILSRVWSAVTVSRHNETALVFLLMRRPTKGPPARLFPDGPPFWQREVPPNSSPLGVPNCGIVNPRRAFAVIPMAQCLVLVKGTPECTSCPRLAFLRRSNFFLPIAFGF